MAGIELRLQATHFLLILDSLGAPALRLFALLGLAAKELLLAGNQPRRVPLQLLLAARGPLLEPPLLFDQRAVLVDQQSAKGLELPFPLG